MSGQSSFTTLDASYYEAMDNLSFSIYSDPQGNYKFDVSWDDNNLGDGDQYQLEYAINGGSWQSNGSWQSETNWNGNSCSGIYDPGTNPSAGDTIDIRLREINLSPYSNWATATTAIPI